MPLDIFAHFLAHSIPLDATFTVMVTIPQSV